VSSEHEDYLRLRERTIGIGVWVTHAVIGAMVPWVIATWDRPHRGLVAIFLVTGSLMAAVVGRLPREWIVRSRHREKFFLAWSLGCALVISAVAIADGGAGSPFAVVYFLTIIFAALSYPLRSVVAVSAVNVAAFATIGLLVPGIPEQPAPSLGYEWVFTVCLALTGVMCALQSRIQTNQREELLRLARVDPLTGALNRRGFAEHAVGALPGGLVVMDLEGFKAVNDEHGHHAGDDLLCWTVAVVGALLRPDDAVGRLGGDEFAVLLAGVDRDSADAVAVRIRAALAERVAVTTGVAAAPEDGEDLDDLVHAADLRLYAARRQEARPLLYREPDVDPG
jgi:diguanylate cyclase (GGDEF)-like protein